MCEGTLRGSTRLLAVVVLLGLGAAAAQEADGQALYQQHCAACHGPEGQSAAEIYPALAGNELLLGAPEAPVMVVLEGRGAMPAFGGTLSDEQIAALVTHERTSWGNDADAVDADLVAQVRGDGDDGDAEDADDGEDGAEEADGAPADFAWEERGAEVYAEFCAACHREDGSGVDGAFPALAGNPFVTADPEAVVRLPLFGRGGMPSLGGALDDEAVAAVLNHVRTSWGNDADPIGPALVADVRDAGSQPDAPVANGDADEGDAADDDQDGGGVLDRPGAAD